MTLSDTNKKPIDEIILKDIKMEVFQDYKKPSMLLSTAYCTWKCCTEHGLDISVCQNSELAKQRNHVYKFDMIYNMYQKNGITKAIIIAGLEPMLQFQEVISLIDYFRSRNSNDTFVIYTGYNKEELVEQIEELKKYPNIVVKYGRYVPDSESRYDEVLGITLASSNQYAEQIS